MDRWRQTEKIVLQQSVVPEYRKEPFSLLRDHWGTTFVILAGTTSFEPTMHTEVTLSGTLRIVPNRFVLGRRLLWQADTLRELVTSRVAIVELNPRNISVWLALIIRRITRRRSVLWGHAWPRSGPNSQTDWLRQRMRVLGDTIVVYTEGQRDELLKRMPEARIIAAPNALYRCAQLDATATESPRQILFVGRLISAKKPRLLLDAFSLAVERGLPGDYTLTFAGDGPERSVIESILDSRESLRTRVSLLGHVSPSKMQGLYRNTLVSVSPGYVGLSITQSFSFGVPMIIARDEPHSPEIEAAVEGINSVFFPSDDLYGLADAILAITSRSAMWRECRDAIVRHCASSYTAEKMAAGVIDAVDRRDEKGR